MRRFLSFPHAQRRAAVGHKRRRNRSNLRASHSTGWICPPPELLEPRRLLAAGDLDPTFGAGGVAASPFGFTAWNVTAMALQPDGKTIEAGSTSQGYVIARYNFDGTADKSFGSGGTVVIDSPGSPHQVAIAPDGDIVVVGDRNGVGTDDTLVVRLTPDGTPDPSFGTNGEEMLDQVGRGSGLAISPAGTIYITGGSGGAYVVARLNDDGSIDTTFGEYGVASLPAPPFNDGGPQDLILQPDGKILAGGDGSAYVTGPGGVREEVTDLAVVRFNSDGTPDTSFGTGGVVQTTFSGLESAMAIQSNGKIVLAGWSSSLSSAGSDLAMVRYNNDGTLDSTFGNGGQVLDSLGSDNSMISALFVEPDGKIVATGQADDSNALFRFNSDGSLDNSFGNGGIVLDPYGADGILEQPDGKFLVAGDVFKLQRYIGETPPTTSGIMAVRVPENSPATVIALSHDFQGGSVPANQLIYSITADSNPAIFASAGIDPQTGDLTLSYAANQSGAARLTVRATDPDGAYVESSFGVTVEAGEPSLPGTLNPTFGTNGVVVTSTQGIGAGLNFALTLPDGKILTTGGIQPNDLSNGNYTASRYNPDGSVDTSFGDNGVATAVINGGATGGAVQADGKILVCGNSDGFSTATIVRFNADGSLDTSFGADGVVSTPIGDGAGIALQRNQKIVVASLYQGGFGVARYNPDGTLDTTFGTGGIVHTIVGVGDQSGPTALTIQPDGKILVTGLAWDGSKFDFGIVRYDTTGALDASFGNGGIVITSLSSGDDEPYEVTLQPNGQIIVTGYSSGEGALVRYNSDGTLDTSFGDGGISRVPAADVLYQSVVQPNGYIVTAGNVGGFNFGVFRFRPDGNLDTSFNGTGYARATGVSGVAEAVAVAADGDYIVVGPGGTTEGAAGTVALARFDGSFAPPTALGISDVRVPENGPATVIALPDDFQGGSVSAGQLVYMITADSNPELFSSTEIDPQTGDLAFDYAPNQTGAAQLTVRAIDPDGAYVDSSFNVTLTTAPTLTSVATTVQSVEGASFSETVAMFTDSDPSAIPADFTATIDWGDASAPTTVSASQISETAGTFSVAGSHTYAEEGTYTATITINDGNEATATVQSVANVADAKLHLTAAAAVNPAGGDVSNVLLATFTDDGGPEPVSNYSATIDWGDGATGAGTIALSNGVFQITGSHQYARSGSFTIGVSVADDGGSMDALVEATGVQLTPHQEYVIAVYHDVLGRAPDAAGLTYWTAKIDQGAAIGGVAQAIAHSDEYFANFVIEPDYLKLLGRAADEADVTFWIQKMQNGLTDQGVAAELAASDEFYARAGANGDATSDSARNTDWIDAVYSLLLGRAASTADETYWVGELNSGVSRGQITQWIANSAENDAQLIKADYQTYLGRPADPDGLAYWLKQLAAGESNEDVIAEFASSAEYYGERS